MSKDRPAEIGGIGRRILLSVVHAGFKLSRGMTLGVRAACFNDRGQIFLVRHTYLPGWYMPGGGVEYHETAEEALTKELREEGNLVIVGTPRLFHVYYNNNVSKRDHVLLYQATVTQPAPRPPNWEISDSGFFDLDDLPPDTTPSTRRRLAELRGEESPSAYW